MKRAIILLTLFLLSMSIVSAQATLFSVETGEEGITIKPLQDVREIMVLANEEVVQEYDSLNAMQEETITLPSGEHNLEIRYVKSNHYVWERPDVTKNDAPASLKYVEYDKEDKTLDFSFTGADFIHPDELAQGTSNKALLKSYSVMLNDYVPLTSCYPRVTTGKNLFFGCKANEYANKAEIEFSIGISEKTTITITGTTTQEETPTKEPIIVEEPTEEAVVEEITTDVEEEGIEAVDEAMAEVEELLLDEPIELKDTIQTRPSHMPVTVFVILMFLAFMTILFVASHHNHESKKAGTHHKTRKK